LPISLKNEDKGLALVTIWLAFEPRVLVPRSRKFDRRHPSPGIEADENHDRIKLFFPLSVRGKKAETSILKRIPVQVVVDPGQKEAGSTIKTVEIF